ncbi:MAG: enoyl-CoA hydratase [Alteromonas sp.]|uniref:crotonase/enoyl-CoA hydratase family protein n=1 Tax=unclassified Alteromonas TaxID=2614992 RepID=UPI0009033A24|nr:MULTISPECIES: crotonase/enoyl-CoA hydratase family protein [unclassified Alteromonas]APE07682.1 enoyl-CoA hydratase [Alteromonas sp. RW2A1]AUC90211.1 enoyl-CoA hydratase [Alteromonas sp. MB-3u-76]MAI64759.1 enoyl-CoA hydratase [Alteromonas sp.]
MNYSTLEIKYEGFVAHIVLNRPEAMNSMNPAFWTELPAAVRAIDDEAKARVIIISSTGKHFSAGMDLAVFLNMKEDFKGDPSRRAERMRRTVKMLQDSFTAIEEVRMPVIGAVQGGAIGGAVDLLSACDMRYCTQDAFFSIKETQIGMTADVGTLQRLPKLIPIGMVKELAYTGRNFAAQEAQQLGFINEIFDDHEQMLSAVTKVAQQIAANSPLAVSGTKTMINYATEHTVSESLDYMATWQAGMFHMEDVFTAMEAQKKQQQPEFPPLHSAVKKLAQ